MGDACRRAPYQRTRLRLRWRASRSGGLRPMTQWPARCARNQGCQLSTNRCGPTSSGTRSPAPPALLRRRSRFPWRLECPAVTRACSNHIDPFDGAKSVHSARHATQRDACVSGKLRNDDDGPIWPTIVQEARLRHDRPVFHARRAALCFTCGRVRPRREACLASRREKPVKWVNMIGTCSRP